MSIQQSQADRNDKQYFNLHLEGFANLYKLRWIKPKPGQSFQPFMQVRGTYLQGRHDNAQPLFVDFKITGSVAKKVMEHFADAIADEAQKVSAVVKSGDIRTEAKMHNGKPVAFTSARMLTVKYLKVNGEVIDLTPFQEGGEVGRVVNLAEHSQKRQDEPKQPEQAQGSESLPMRVKLDKDAPGFAQRKAELKAAGYRWDGVNFEWTLAPREQASA